MSSIPVTLRVTGGGVDLSSFVTAVGVSQGARQIHREFRVMLTGYTHVDPEWQYDITASYGSGAGEVLIRRGIVPPDWQPSITVGPHGSPPQMEIQGVDWVWLAARVRWRNTIVVAPNRKDARRALEQFDERTDRPTGRTTYVHAETMHGAIRHLGALAGFSVVPLLPDYRIQGHVCDPHESIWESIWRLAEVFAPTAYFRRERNEVVIGDRVLAADATSGVSLPASLVTSLAIEPVRDGYYRRVLVRMPEWENSTGTQGTMTRTGEPGDD